MSDSGTMRKRQTTATDDDDGGAITLVAKHSGTGRYATFKPEHLDASQPEVAQKLSYLSGSDD